MVPPLDAYHEKTILKGDFRKYLKVIVVDVQYEIRIFNDECRNRYNDQCRKWPTLDHR